MKMINSNMISSLIATLIVAQASGQVVSVNGQVTMGNFFFFFFWLGLSPERVSARCPSEYAEIESCIVAECADYHTACAKPPNFVPPPERIGQEEPLSCGMLHDGFCSEFAPTASCCLSTRCAKPVFDAVTCLSKTLHGLDRSHCPVPTDCRDGTDSDDAAPHLDGVVAATTPATPQQQQQQQQPPATTTTVTTPATTTTTTTEGEAAAPLTQVMEDGDAITISRSEYNSLLNDMAVLTDILKDMEIRLMKLAPQVPAS